VGGDKDGELLYMAASDPLNKQIPINQEKKKEMT
jgi:hypothetical protein